VPLVAGGDRSRRVDGYTVTLTTPPLMSLVTQDLSFRVERDGQPVTDLENFLGALGHLIVISEDRRQFVHSHPLVRAAGDAPPSMGPTVLFSALFPAPGKYKAWGQFQHADRVITADFVLEIASPR
jgi:hypothetical protein